MKKTRPAWCISCRHREDMVCHVKHVTMQRYYQTGNEADRTCRYEPMDPPFKRGDVVVLPAGCETDRRWFPCPLAGQRAVVSDVSLDESCPDHSIVFLDLPRAVLCDYEREIHEHTAAGTTCVAIAGTLRLAQRGTRPGENRTLEQYIR